MAGADDGLRGGGDAEPKARRFLGGRHTRIVSLPVKSARILANCGRWGSEIAFLRKSLQIDS
jgi:hypothetical protein